MKWYVQFFSHKMDGSLGEACGSDSVFILDGRNKLQVMIQDAKKRIEFLRNVARFEYFEIRRCYRISDQSQTVLYSNFFHDKDGKLFRRF